MKRLAFILLSATSLASGADLPVTDGLILHLDASTQNVARQKASLSPLANARPLDRWLDATGGTLVAVQPSAAARPVFRSGEAEAFVRFDGKDDFLSLSGPRRLSPQATIFVLAAPRSNSGNFSALFATSEAGKNDYTNGLNLDFGPAATKQLSVLNVESAGSTGFHDLLEPGRNLAAELPFDSFHVFTVRSRIGEKGNELFLDGVRLGERTRLESNIGLDEMVIGGRLCSNDPGQPPYAQGFFHGDMAAVLVYNRALSDAEREKVEQALFSRTPALNALAAGSAGHALEVLSDPPPVQMLVPGFTVHEMPVKLTNINSIRYRHDGKLVALGYDGRLHLLSDTDGDGLEDKAELFWDKSSLRGPIGIALLPKGDPRGEGVYVASKGKVSLILDKDRDGRGDEEVIVATGWKENFTNVDAVGLAVDPRDGSIYFSLGVENFASAYLVDPATGKSRFQLSTERGTIQRVSPDFSKRETVSTGVRFACALAFNRHGDLFATEQEGATWLPNGNPFDELLHIVPGRHYGFPPRHPRHLPQVIDEPAVMEYGPQHQSTVGMVFNEGVNGGPAFGPAHWQGDALVCGESRGKLYRTKLVKTVEGYVAQNQLIACLSMLTVDTCVSPQGDLLVACHSGPPDWGTGPAGEGKLFKVRYSGKQTPQPVWAWAAGPDEFRIAFDRPLKTEDWVGAKEKVRIEAGQFVSAGDRYEVIRPGYQVVRDQMAAPRRWVDVHSLSLSADQRTLILRVPRQTDAVNYAVTIPVPASWQPPQGNVAQRAEMDMAVSLHGVEATLKMDGQTTRVVLPHASLPVSKELTASSAEHTAFFGRFENLSGSDEFSLRGGLDVSNVFVPMTQPGSVLDWDIASDRFANKMMTAEYNLLTGSSRAFTVEESAEGKIKPLQMTLAGKVDSNSANLVFQLDQQKRPVSLNRQYVPWARAASDKASPPATTTTRNDVKGRWLHGKRLFFGQAGCFSCHTIRGEGTAFGPDLTNLVHRDRDSVTHDIVQPSATINPDQAGSTVKFKDGTSINGIVRTLNAEKVIIRLPGGAETERARAEVVAIEPMKTSLMPDGFGQQLSKEQMEDLLTFLLTNPLEPAPITRLEPPAPAPRSRGELTSLLPQSASTTAKLSQLRVLLSAGDKDHGVDEHDYPLWLDRWSRLLALADNVTVSTCIGFPTREQLSTADVTVFYSRNADWDKNTAALLDEYQQRGGGVVYLHWAVNGASEPEMLAERIGLASADGARFRHGEMDLVFAKPEHPITKGFERLRFIDETYWALHGNASRFSTLATSIEENEPRPQLWVMQRQNGRVFGCVPGHYTWTFDDPLYRLLVLRGIAWAAQQEDVDRFAELATVGARIAP
ncbi:ThuA domain-containing protein [Verrucomicrobiota bacterium sgz303538]